MKIQLIRSATIKLYYAGQTILIDPYLAARYSRPSFTGKSLNPLVDLPFSPEEVIIDIDLVIVSHMHSDHFDPAAQELLPKAIPILCQPEDQKQISRMRFSNTIPILDQINWKGIDITRTPCQHGSGNVLAEMGSASGFILKADKEPTVYWVGDTIWFDGVEAAIMRNKPKIIITHSCGAEWGDQVLILMDDVQTAAVCKFSPNSVIVATHMEALDHATVSRVDLRQYATDHGISNEQLLIPADGETIKI